MTVTGMHILALDIAATTGWARLRRNDAPTFGIKRFPLLPLGLFADEFERWLLATVTFSRITELAVEAPVPQRSGATSLDVLMRAYGAHVILQMACRRLGLPVLSVNVGTWRKHFIGTARAPGKVGGKLLSAGQRRTWLKKSVIAKCRARGWDVTSDDAADALGLLDYARTQIDPIYGANSSSLFQQEAA